MHRGPGSCPNHARYSTVIPLEITPDELNFLQVAVDDLIDVQRSVIVDVANQTNNIEIESLYVAVQRLDTGLNLKYTFEEINP